MFLRAKMQKNPYFFTCFNLLPMTTYKLQAIIQYFKQTTKLQASILYLRQTIKLQARILYFRQPIKLQVRCYAIFQANYQIAGYPPVQGSWSLSFLRDKYLLSGESDHLPIFLYEIIITVIQIYLDNYLM